jgi:uncharacterized protein
MQSPIEPARTHIILYVRDQETSRRFYETVLGIRPSLHVPGMTEFQLASGTILGLMPEAGIARVLHLDVEAIAPAGHLRSELYLVVDEPETCHQRALDAGASELSPLAVRNWGHAVAYSLDPDGYVLAFAGEAT